MTENRASMQRHPANPIITPAQVRPSHPEFRVRGAFNPGAITFGDEILLLLRVAEDVPAAEGRVRVPIVEFDTGRPVPRILDLDVDDPDVQRKDTRGVVHKGRDYLSTLSHLRLARSRDGINFTVDPEPFLMPADESERFGVEDARISRIGDDYWINFTVVSNDGWATALASTRDFRSVTRHGIIFPPQNKDVSIFPEKIGDRYFALHRPNNSGFGRPSIWSAESPDLLHWGRHKCLLRPRDTVWEEQKIGGGAPSLRTPEGWLQVYHGKGQQQRYSLFTALLDPDDPSRVLKRATTPFLVPEADYEVQGFFGGVVFTNGLICREDGSVLLYYGACDEVTCVATTSVGELLATLDQ